MPLPEKPSAHTSLAAPATDVLTPAVWEVLLGDSEYDRSLHVMIGTMVSIRASIDAAAYCTWPPYEPPIMPTRGSFAAGRPEWSVASRCTTSRTGAGVVCCASV